MPVLVALIRAIGPETHLKMSMADLREACRTAGVPRAETYIATGNLILETRKSGASVQRLLETILRGFGLEREVFLRRPEELAALVAADPFPQAAAERPANLAVCFLAAEPSPEGVARLVQHRGPERIALLGRELCIDYREGITGSRLSPAVVERRLGMPATARNWNTVRKLSVKAEAFRVA
jgi:uncharacterized protein (DUF1697 family)